jgi:NAD(P)-dependent dehydrogenase (short-subunit alcohol dehydrogenase family)
MASKAGHRLEGKVALVTGASKGIGKAVAAAYANEGATVFICARNQAQLNRAVDEIRAAGGPGQVYGLAGDVGNAEDAKRLVSAAQQQVGAIQILVNNASLLGPRAPIAEYPISAWEEVIRVNLTGPFLMTREALQVMIPRHEGSIINVSSGVGRVGRARWGAYAASKFGLEGLTQLTADEVREFGIRVNAVNPGPTRTDMRAAAYPEEDPLTLPVPDEITAVFLHLASDESRAVTGQSFEAEDWSKPLITV